MKINASTDKPFEEFVAMVRGLKWMSPRNQDMLILAANMLSRDAYERGIEEGKRQCQSTSTKRSKS